MKRTAVGIITAFLPGPAGDVAGPLVEARVLWDKERQGYHDLSAGTHVVRQEQARRSRRPRRRHPHADGPRAASERLAGSLMLLGLTSKSEVGA